MLLLAIWLILHGVIGLGLAIPQGGIILALLALAVGILMLLDR